MKVPECQKITYPSKRDYKDTGFYRTNNFLFFYPKTYKKALVHTDIKAAVSRNARAAKGRGNSHR